MPTDHPSLLTLTRSPSPLIPPPLPHDLKICSAGPAYIRQSEIWDNGAEVS